MESILADIQDQVVSHVEDGVTDSDGDQHMAVEMIYTDDEFEIAEYIADHERRISQIPHAFVFAGTAVFEGQDSTRRMQQLEVPVRVFVAARNASTENQQVQHRLASKWSVYVAAAVAGKRVRTTGTSDAYLEDVNVESIANIERSALWEVRFTVPLNLDTDDILLEIDNE